LDFGNALKRKILRVQQELKQKELKDRKVAEADKF
jgi:hypothetical protein